MQNLINQLTHKTKLSYEQARNVLSLVSKEAIQNANPTLKSELFSKLPSEIYNTFSENDIEELLVLPPHRNNIELCDQIGLSVGIKESKKSKIITNEAIKILQRRIGIYNLLI